MVIILGSIRLLTPLLPIPPLRNILLPPSIAPPLVSTIEIDILLQILEVFMGRICPKHELLFIFTLSLVAAP